MNIIKDFLQNATPKAKVVTFSGVFAFIAIIIISVINIISANQTTPEYVNITNFSESIYAPKYLEEYAEAKIWSIIKNLDNVSASKPLDFKVREGSVTKYGDGTTRAVVDIDSLHYSFAIDVYFSENPQPQSSFGVSVSCPKPSEIIYSDTPCPIGTPIDQLSALLPADIDENGIIINASIAPSTTGRFVKISVQSPCPSSISSREAEFIFRRWLKLQYLDPNDFNISTQVCSNI